MKSALIVDDHHVIRAMIILVLRKEGFEQFYEASSGEEVLQMVRDKKPDLVILDLHIPGRDGLEVLERITAEGLGCHVLVFTSHPARFYQDRCMRAGAAAYVSKSDDLQHLHKAVHAVMAGYRFFIQLPTTSVFLDATQRSESELINNLSSRELTILQYLARGNSNKDIAETMHLSFKTVSTYKSRLITKLNVHSLVHLRDFAQRNHLI